MSNSKIKRTRSPRDRTPVRIDGETVNLDKISNIDGEEESKNKIRPRVPRTIELEDTESIKDDHFFEDSKPEDKQVEKRGKSSQDPQVEKTFSRNIQENPNSAQEQNTSTSNHDPKRGDKVLSSSNEELNRSSSSRDTSEENPSPSTNNLQEDWNNDQSSSPKEEPVVEEKKTSKNKRSKESLREELLQDLKKTTQEEVQKVRAEFQSREDKAQKKFQAELKAREDRIRREYQERENKFNSKIEQLARERERLKILLEDQKEKNQSVQRRKKPPKEESPREEVTDQVPRPRWEEMKRLGLTWNSLRRFRMKKLREKEQIGSRRLREIQRIIRPPSTQPDRKERIFQEIQSRVRKEEKESNKLTIEEDRIPNYSQMDEKEQLKYHRLLDLRMSHLKENWKHIYPPKIFKYKHSDLKDKHLEYLGFCEVINQEVKKITRMYIIMATWILIEFFGSRILNLDGYSSFMISNRYLFEQIVTEERESETGSEVINQILYGKSYYTKAIIWSIYNLVIYVVGRYLSQYVHPTLVETVINYFGIYHPDKVKEKNGIVDIPRAPRPPQAGNLIETISQDVSNASQYIFNMTKSNSNRTSSRPRTRHRPQYNT